MTRPLPPALELRDFRVAFGARTILSSVDLAVPARGTTLLMGPAGTGKSTLLRTLAGFNQASPSLSVGGSATIDGAVLGGEARPALVAQDARLLLSDVHENLARQLPDRERLTRAQQAERIRGALVGAGLDELADRLDAPVVGLRPVQQRLLAIVRSTLSNPVVLMTDEPTAGLEEPDAQRVLDLLDRIARSRAVLVVTHNQRHARRLGGPIYLLAGGRIVAHGQLPEFFDQPATELVEGFTRTGSCCVAPPADAAVDEEPPPTETGAEVLPAAPTVVPMTVGSPAFRRAALGPTGFLWVVPGRLAGTPMPGIVYGLDHDLAALKRVGVTHLISLLEQEPDHGPPHRYGIRGSWLPVVDMCPPTIAQAIDLCTRIDHSLRDGEVVAVHCRAGLGRTGTALAAWLIWDGASALDALERVRRIEPKFVQSQSQVAFLEAFQQHLSALPARRIAGARSVVPFHPAP